MFKRFSKKIKRLMFKKTKEIFCLTLWVDLFQLKVSIQINDFFCDFFSEREDNRLFISLVPTVL